MMVGVCLTKLSEGAISWVNAFSEGVFNHGDQVFPIARREHLEFLGAECDVSVQVADQHFSNNNVSPLMMYKKDQPCGAFEGFALENFRAGIIHVQKKNNKPRIILDRGFVSAPDYFSVCINEIKRLGLLHTANSPSDRWGKLDISPPQWRTDGNHVLVIGQNEHGTGTQSIRQRGMSFLDWSNKTLQNIRKYTNRKIIYKPHPNQKRLPSPVERCTLLPLGKSKIDKYLSDCWCAVAAASNGAADCVMNGIPVITNDPMSIVYGISSHGIEEINNPKTPDISQWLNDTAYSQWNVEEMKSGETWRYIKNHLTGGTDGT